MDIVKYLEKFYAAAGIPAMLFKDGALSAQFDKKTSFENVSAGVMNCVLNAPHSISYIITDEQLLFGLVRLTDANDYIIVGPAHTFKLNGDMSVKVAKAFGVSEHEFEWYLNSMPLYEPQRFSDTLSMLSFCVNGRNDVPVRIQYTPQTLSAQGADTRSNIEFIEHLDTTFDKEILSHIEYGRYEEVEKLMDGLGTTATGLPDVAPDVIRSIKNIYLYTLGVTSRAALKGGLDFDTMTAIVDHCLNTIEQANDIGVITRKITHMFIGFARATASAREIPADSMLVTKIVRVVRAGLYEKMTPTIIAEKLSMSAAYLCAHFKKETGKTISQYVNEVKIDEAKRLLSSTQLTLSEISARLDYSSQSYFQNLFKEITGVTPRAYRG